MSGSRKKTVDTDHSLQQLLRVRLENLPADPPAAELDAARIWYDTTLDRVRAYDGAQVRSLAWEGTSGALTVTKQPLYEYRDIWAEESGGTNANNAEWSYGNGATGFMGLPIDANWECVALGFSSDTYAATATITIDLMSYNTPSNAAANTIASLSLASAADGAGGTNNAHKYENLATPVAVPAGLIGFITRGETGNISDARVYARLRRQIGEYVSDVTIA